MATLDGKAVAGIGPKPENMNIPSAWTSYLATDDADQLAGKVASNGGQLMMPPFDVMDIGRMFVAMDPTGASFGVWQAKAHIGVEVFNEPGTLVWNELHSQDYVTAQSFYAEVFNYTFTEIGDGQRLIYSTFALPGARDATDNIGGLVDDSKQPGEQSYWLSWFATDDTEATVAKAKELGATVMMAAELTPFGQMGIVAGLEGEVFGVIDVNRKAA